MTNLAFHNDESLAAIVRSQVAAHTAADEIIQGKYWKNGKGCFFGCIAHGNDPEIVENMTGFPVMLTRIAESIFEGLPNDIAKGFPERVIAAPRIGADLSLVAWNFLHWAVADALQHADAVTRNACTPALEIVAARARGENINRAAADAAYAARAAAYAARAAARAAAYAARAAAYAADAAYAAAYAARAAAYAADAAYAAAYAARAAADAAYAADAARIRQAGKLVELLASA